MQALAREVGFSETVFVLPPDRRHVRIRIFTPFFELPFAGHPTLGTAFVLGAPLQLEAITLETGPATSPSRSSGTSRADRVRADGAARAAVEPFEAADELFEALGVAAPSSRSSATTTAPPTLRRARRARRWSRHCDRTRGGHRLGVTGVTCFAGSGGRWTSRMFWAGGEDAATGSAAGPLACHLARHGWIAWGDEIVSSRGRDREAVDAYAAPKAATGDRPRLGRRPGRHGRAGRVPSLGVEVGTRQTG